MHLPQNQFEPSAVRESHVLKHDRQLVRCRFTACGKFVVAGSYDGTLRRWHLETGEQIVLQGHSGWLTDLVFTPDGSRMLSVDSWGKLACWTDLVGEPKLLWSHEGAHASWIRQVAASPDGKLVATAGNDRSVRLWSVADGAPAGELKGHDHHVYSLAFHPDGQSLVSGDLFGVVKHWDVAGLKAVRDLDASPLYTRPEGKILDCGGVRGMAVSGDGKYLACSGITDYGTSVVRGFPAVVLIDWASGERLHLLRPQNFEKEFESNGLFVEVVAFTPEGYLIGVGGNGEREGEIWFWKPPQPGTVFEVHKVPGSRGLDLHPSGLAMAVVQFLENGRGKNGGNGRKAEMDEYQEHHGLVRIYQLTAKPAESAEATETAVQQQN